MIKNGLMTSITSRKKEKIMEIKQIQHGHLTLFGLPAEEHLKTQGTVLILGNAYGIMPYQTPLANALAEKGITPWWFAFSGQEGSTYAYSGESGLKDIATALKYLSLFRDDKPLWVIAHCAGSLMALEYLKRNPCSPVDKLIVYGLLFNPNRRKSFALQKFKECGVKEAVLENEWDYNPLEAISGIQIPILFCHAKDKLNLFRARQDEMREVLAAAQDADITWLEKGYDNDINILPEYVDRYYSFLTSTVSEPIPIGG